MKLSTILKNTILLCDKTHIFKICNIIIDTMCQTKNKTRTILTDNDALSVMRHICSFEFNYGTYKHYDIVFVVVCMITWGNPQCIKEFKNTTEFYQYLIIYFPFYYDYDYKYAIDMFGIAALTLTYFDNINIDLIEQYFDDISIGETKFCKEAFKRILKRTRYVINIEKAIKINKKEKENRPNTSFLFKQSDLFGNWRSDVCASPLPLLNIPSPIVFDSLSSLQLQLQLQQH